MEGNWLTKTKKAYVYHDGEPSLANPVGVNGWRVTLLHGQDDFESFWYPTWELAVRAIPELWRH